MSAHERREFALYIHVPWCVKKCPYCDFNSHAINSDINESAYLQALLEDLAQWQEKVSERTLSSIFIGGGTPSVMSPGFYRQLLHTVREQLQMAADIEITMEANPGTADMANFAGYREAGINRLSIGVQSLSDKQLKQLGRIHNASQAQQAMTMARSAGFDNVNLDLMFALPGQSTDQALEDLAQATELQPQHLSWYQLTLEPNTAFYAEPPVNLPDDSLAWEIQQAGQQYLAAAGYRQYEISAYCQPGHECRHNLNYWRFGDYLGIGAGAHGKLTGENGEVERHSKKRHPTDYLAGSYLSKRQRVPPRELVLEFLMNRLRIAEPIDRDALPPLAAAENEWLKQQLELALERGLLQAHGAELSLTARGQQYLNEVLLLFT